MTMITYLTAIVVAIGLAVATTPAAAQVFKCATPAGKVEYRDFACDPSATAQSIDTRANTIGTGENLESIRAQNESMTRRLDARRAADERALERQREAREWAFYNDRTYHERDDAASGYGYGNVYWPAYVTPRMRRHATPALPPARVPPPAIVTRKKS